MEAGPAAGWKHSFDLRLAVSVGPVLELALTARNTGDSRMTVGGALHGYFAVSDVRKVRLRGLEGKTFVDPSHPAERRVQQGPVEIGAETDRVYDDPGDRLVLEDPLLGRRIVVEKSGSRSTVVWNPWMEKAKSLSDIGEDQFRDFLCVEPANALGDVVTLAPGEEHRLTASIQAEPM
jgi:glucose-6-phosphate 1-epimerase